MTDYEPRILSTDTQRHLTQILSESKPKLVVEIGSWLGESARLILLQQSVKMLYCVDTWLGSLEHQGMDAYLLDTIYERFLANCKDLVDRLEPVRMDSVNGVLFLGQRGFEPDLVFLDGGHHYWQVTADLNVIHECWPKTPILCDDARDRGVANAITHFAMKTQRPTELREWSCLIA